MVVTRMMTLFHLVDASLCFRCFFGFGQFLLVLLRLIGVC